MFIHTFYTWLLANLLQIVIVLGWGIYHSDPDPGITTEWSALGILFIVSIVLSIPCLLASWVCLPMIVGSQFTPVARFALWVVAVVFWIACEGCFILLLLLDIVEPGACTVFLPAMIASVLAIIIRYPQFNRLINSYKLTHDETNLV